MIDHIVAPRNMKEIRDIVNIIKKTYGLNNTLQFPVIFFWEQIVPTIFQDYRFLYVDDDDDELEGLEAYTDHNLKIVKMKVGVYLRALEGSYKDLFTICHEAGHLFLHNGQAMIFARTSKRFPAYKSAEWQANYFAAELLMSSHLIIGMSVDDISKSCNVCKKAALIQLEHAVNENEKGLL